MRGDSKEHGRHGFTLVELMVVMVLMGIMAATIIPEMRGTFEEALLKSTSRELLGVFSMAASRAVSINQVHRFRLDLRSGKYTVERPAHEGEQGDNGYVTAREAAGSEGRLDNRIKIEFQAGGGESAQGTDEGGSANNEVAGNASRDSGPSGTEQIVSFYPDGTADAEDILLQDRQGFRLALHINPVTARVKVMDLKKE